MILTNTRIVTAVLLATVIFMASFAGDSKTPVDQDIVSGCYDCHIPAKESNYVYSKYRP